MIDTLVIACGNRLRGDDGVAPVAAEMVSAWEAPGVRVTIVHQLTPELIEEIEQAGRVVFMDAATDIGDAAMAVRKLQPRKTRSLFGHQEAPENLLALMAMLEKRVPEAWLVSIHALSFSHGDFLTDETQRCLIEAIAWLRRFLLEQVCTRSA